METGRIILRRWREADLEPFAAMCADPRVMEYYPALLSREECLAGIARMEQRFDLGRFSFWALESKDDGAFLGLTGLNQPTFQAPFMPCVEIGWRLAFAHWGKGYATEAARASLAYAFDKCDLLEVVAFTARDNMRSRRVMVKLGMKHDPLDDFDHPGVPDGHALQRHVLYRIHNGRRAGSAPAEGPDN